MRRHRVILVFALILALAGTASAWQVEPNPPVAPVAPAITVPCQTELASLRAVKVTKVWPVPPLDEELGTKGKAGASASPTPTPTPALGENGLPLVKLRDTVAVKVENLQNLLGLERCLDTLGTEKDIILYLNRRPLPDVVAAPPNDPEKKVLMFPLARTEKSREVWTHLLSRPSLDDREVEVSVGINDQFAVGSTAYVDLRVIPYGWFAAWLLIFGILVAGFILLARRSNLLRDPVKAPYGARPPYSLARGQAAWWFFLILASYLLIGMVTGDFLTSPTGTVLVLLGISAGTAAGSAFIDASKSSRGNDAQDIARAKILWEDIETLDTQTTALESAVRESGDLAKAQELADKTEMRKEKASMYRKLINESEGLLLDVLSDSSGVNFHRFQAVAWTLVLGIIFVSHVYRDLAMPQFDETLLGLMGISSGTYLSLKIPEKPSPDPVPPTPPAPPNPPPAQ